MFANPVLLGFLISALAHAFFTAFDAVSKITIANYSVFQVLATEYVTALLLTLAYFTVTRGKELRNDLKIHDWKIFAGAGAFRFAGQMLLFFGVTHVTLADFYVALFTTPLIVAVLSTVLLKEKVGKTLLITMGLCFIGTLIALRPGENMNWWVLMVLAGAVILSAFVIILRKGTQKESTLALSFYVVLISAIGMLIPAFFVFKMPSLIDFTLMMLGGIFFGVANIMYAAAMRMAPAPYVSGAQFLQLIYGSAVGFVLFADVPSLWTYGGGALVIAANIYLIVMQNRQVRPAE